MPAVIHFHRELGSAVLHIGIMWLTKLYLLGLLSFTFLTLSRGQKLTCAKDESKSNQQNGKSLAEINKLTPVCNLTDNKPKVSFVFSLKPSDKSARKLPENHENIEAIREKLMKTLLENGDVKTVNSLGLNSEETANRKHMQSKHEEVWALMDEIMKRKHSLRKEIEEFYKRGRSKTRKRYEPEESEQTDNSGEDYSEENMSNEGRESESDETPDERVSFVRSRRKDKRERNYKAAPFLERSPQFPKTEKYPEEAAAVVEDASDEEENIKRNENELRNKNLQLSKLFIQQMKEIYDMENKSRKAKRAKRHYESQIPFPYEVSQESESVEQIKRRSSKKRPTSKKKFYIIDNDPLGFYYYFKHSQKRDPSPVKIYPAVELSNTKISKKKNSKKRPLQLKKKRLPKKKRRYEKEGILIKQIEENHSNVLRNSVNSEDPVLPPSSQLQAKYLYLSGNKMKWSKKDRPIANTEFADFDDFESRENTAHNQNTIEYEPIQQQILGNDLYSEDNFICTPLQPTTEPNMITTIQEKNETEIVQLSPEDVISNTTANQFEDSKLQQTIEDQEQSLDDSPKIRVPRSYRPTTFGILDAGGDCSEVCSGECDQKFDPQDDFNLDELSLYLSLFKKLFEEKSLEDFLPEPAPTKPIIKRITKPTTKPTTKATPTTTTEPTTTTTTECETTVSEASGESDPDDGASSVSCTPASTTPFVVSPGNSGLNLDQIAEEINEAVASEGSDTIVPFEEPPVGAPDPSQPAEKNEQSLLLKRPQGFWLPLKLVQNIDGKFNNQLDLKYICRRCTKQKQKRKRKQQIRSSAEIY